MSDRPAWEQPQRPDDDQPADDAWAAPGPTEPGPTEPGATDPGQTEPAPSDGSSAGPEVTSAPGRPPPLPPPPGEPSADPNMVAIERAGLSDEAAGWLRQVAGQVEPRLDRVSSSWRQSAQAGAARACAFGLLLGYLARLYPHARDDLSRAAEAHPSYSSLPSGSRLQTLGQISADTQRMAAWLGPLVEVSDPRRMQALLD